MPRKKNESTTAAPMVPKPLMPAAAAAPSYLVSSSSTAVQAISAPKVINKEKNPEYLKLKRLRDEAWRDLNELREKNGSRPVASSSFLVEEVKKREKSSWSSLLQEMKWMATDFSQERISKQAQRSLLCSSIIARRIKRKGINPAANAIKQFWEVCNEDVFVNEYEKKEMIEEADGVKDALSFSIGKDIDGTIEERLNSVKNLLSLDSFTHPSTISRYFKGELSPVQFHTLKQLSIYLRNGLSGIICDSERCDHRTTIAALLALSYGGGSNTNKGGPHLIICSEQIDLLYFKSIISYRCPEFSIIVETMEGGKEKELDQDATKKKKKTKNSGNNSFGKNHVILRKLELQQKLEETMEENTQDWGLVVYSGVPISSSLKEKSRSGNCPIFLFCQDILISNPVPELFPKSVNEFVVSPKFLGTEDSEFVLNETLVACMETAEQRKKRKLVTGDYPLTELACIHSDLKSFAALSSAWSNDPLPPPRRTFSSLHDSTISSELTSKKSGKFMEALNLIRSQRCRRAVIFSARKMVLDAFSTHAADHILCYRMDKGDASSKISSWVRFLASDRSCLLARPSDLAYASNKKMNGAIDSIILLDCFTNERDVGLIKSITKHAYVYRLFTRGTIEQHALESAQHPCIILGQGGTPPAAFCDLRIIPRTFEIEEEEDIPVTETYQDHSLRTYVTDYASGKSGSRSYFATATTAKKGNGSKKNDIAASHAPTEFPLYYDASKIDISRVRKDYDFLVQNQEDESPSSFDRPRFLVSFTERQNDVSSVSLPPLPSLSTPSLPGRKRQRPLEEQQLPPPQNAVATTSTTTTTTTNTSTSTSVEIKPFTPLEDLTAKRVLEKFGTNFSFVAEVLNGNRMVRGQQLRTSKQISERLQVLQQTVDGVYEEDSEEQLAIPSSSLSVSQLKKTVGKHFNIWKSVQLPPSLPITKTKSEEEGSLLDRAQPKSVERVGPAQFLVRLSTEQKEQQQQQQHPPQQQTTDGN